VHMATSSIEPVIVERAEQPYVGIRRTITMTTFQVVADCIPVLFGWLAQRGIAPVGPPFVRYDVIDMERELVVEAGVPISSGDRVDTTGAGEPYLAVLPAGRYVTVRHHGRYDELIDVTAALLGWATDLGLVWDSWPTDAGQAWGCRLEHYLTNPADEPDPAAQITDLAFRLAGTADQSA
jgi:effector-binding domain-containing protein